MLWNPESGYFVGRFTGKFNLEIWLRESLTEFSKEHLKVAFNSRTFQVRLKQSAYN